MNIKQWVDTSTTEYQSCSVSAGCVGRELFANICCIFHAKGQHPPQLMIDDPRNVKRQKNKHIVLVLQQKTTVQQSYQ